MPLRNIGQDSIVSVYDAGGFSASPTFGGVIATQAFAKSIKMDDKVNTVDMHAIGDTRKKLRPTFGETQLVVDLMIQGTPVVITMGGNGKIAFQASASQTIVNYTGVWTGNSIDISADNPQTQTITLECDYDNV